MTTKTTTYRLRNWSDYSTALIGRGSLTLWIEEETLSAWRHHEKTGCRGASRTYSDVAIQTVLTLGIYFRLPLRQSQGFVLSLFSLMGVELPVPTYSTLSRRRENLSVALPRLSSRRDEPVHIVIDSTGLKVFGEGEWKVRTHGKAKRRVWRKLHLALDADTGEFLACVTTEGSAADSPQLPALLEQIEGKMDQASLDGAYDSWKVYELLEERGATVTIPPRAGSVIRQHGNVKAPPLQRDQNLREIRRVGKRRWAQESGYSLRALAETGMMRQKRILGGSLSSRSLGSQGVECRLRCQVLNRLTSLGMPDSYLDDCASKAGNSNRGGQFVQ